LFFVGVFEGGFEKTVCFCGVFLWFVAGGFVVKSWSVEGRFGVAKKYANFLKYFQ